MDAHILDRPIWNALTTVHSQFSAGTANALRFQADISPFGATLNDSAENLEALGRLVKATGSIALGQVSPIICPPGTQTNAQHKVSQMLFAGPDLPKRNGHSVEMLGHDDAAAMFDLAKLTKPGPFAQRTHVLGEFWGIKENGRLVAMAGERFRHPGYSEISGVCTHPDYLGRGFGRDLCVKMIETILDRGEQPYLHVFVSNTGAARLYDKLGFEERTQLNTCMLEVA